MTSDQDQTSRAAGGDATSGGIVRAPRPAGSFTATALALLALVVALTGPLWSPALYGNPGAAQIVVLSVAQLRPALESDAPFRNELSLARGALAGQPDVNKALQTLAAYADKGVPTLPELQASFVDSANAVMLEDVVGSKPGRLQHAVIVTAAALHLHALAHWLGGTWPASAIVWEAKTRLDAGDLAGASAALGKLSGPEAKVAQPWIQAAQSRIAANQVLKMLDAVARSQAGVPVQPS